MIQLQVSMVILINYLFMQILPYSVQESYNSAEVVFIGEVVTKKKDSQVYWVKSEATIYNFRIIETLKGIDSSRVGSLITYFSFPRSWDYSFDKIQLTLYMLERSILILFGFQKALEWHKVWTLSWKNKKY